MESIVEETKVIYHIDEEETPYLVKLNKPPTEVTLADFKSGIPVHFHKFKFFFKSKDDDFGVVKEEIIDDQSKLPLFNGRVVAWLVAAEGSVISQSSHHLHRNDDDLHMAPSEILALQPGLQREAGVGETRPPSFHGGGLRGRVDVDLSATETDSIMSSRQDYYDDTESSITSVSQLANSRRRRELMNRAGPQRQSNGHRRGQRPPPLPGPGIPPPSELTSGTITATETSSMTSSEIESSIGDDTEDGQSVASSRFTTSTDHTSVSRNLMLRQRQKKKSKRRVPQHLVRAGSISSVTDSTMSLNVITVTLNMDSVNFLGISIVGQSNKYGDGDCGIYVGSIMKGGAVALDGRIEPGDMILQVNDISFENMSNDDAVRVLKEVVQKPGPIKLVVAKCWDPGTSNKGYFTIPRTEPVRPIDPGAWVAHTAAVRDLETPHPPLSYFGPPMTSGHSRDPLLGDYPGRAPSVTTLSASSIVSSHQETEKFMGIGPSDPGVGLHGAVPTATSTSQLPLTTNSGMAAITKAMQRIDSGLEVRDRMWLKIKISNAFIGSEVVDWLYSNVDGFEDRRDARKYVTQMLKAGYIKHTVNKTTFSEQCYYTFCDDKFLAGNFTGLRLNDADSDPLPLPTVGHPMAIGAPMASAGSGGSGSGQNMIMNPGWVGPPHPLRNEPSPHQWEAPWMGPVSGSGSASTTTYGAIYNPAAPPPSANYTAMASNYSGYGSGRESAYGGQMHPVGLHQSSGSSHHSDNRLHLAGSGSGSESASDGRGSNLAHRQQQIQRHNQVLSSRDGLGSLGPHHHQQPIYQAQ